MIVARTVMASSLLLVLGCGEMLTARHSLPLPESTGLQRFEGRWYTPSGDLSAIIHAGRDPELHFWLPTSPCPCVMENVRFRNGEIQFDVRPYQLTESVSVTFKLLDEDRALVSDIKEPPGGLYFVCGNWYVIFPMDLIRDPSPAWVARARAQQVAVVAAEVGRDVHDGVFDWLARRL